MDAPAKKEPWYENAGLALIHASLVGLVGVVCYQMGVEAGWKGRENFEIGLDRMLNRRLRMRNPIQPPPQEPSATSDIRS